MYVPAGQERQVDELAADEKVPGEQARHAEAVELGAKLPGAQAEHTEADPVLKKPGVQVVQAGDAKPLKNPLAHGAQLYVELLKDPAGQPMHVVMPMSGA